MVTLISKSSSQIKFPGNPGISVLHGPQTVTVETGVAVFTLTGTNPHDWTRDTLTFPVGAPCPAADFAGGIAAAAPTSFWTPMNNITGGGGGVEQVNLQVYGSTSGGDGVSGTASGEIAIPGALVPPPIGVAIDSATIAYSAQHGQPAITMALAVFGNNCAMLRASYTAFIVNGTSIIVTGGGGGELENK